MNREQLIAFSQNFGKGIGNTTRFEILIFLVRGAQTVSEIAEHISASQPMTSQHLLVLKNSQLIVSEKRGLYVYYSLNFDYMLNGLKGITTVIEHKSHKEEA